MSDPRAMGMYERWTESSEKLDYFVLGICVALTGYLGSHYAPAHVGVNPVTLELVSLLCFGVATGFGLLRVSNGVVYWGAQYAFLEVSEKAGQLKQLLATRAGVGIVNADGQVMSVPQAAAYASQLSHSADKAAAERAKWSVRFARWYHPRNTMLALGIVLYLAAKVWATVIVPKDVNGGWPI